nr:unnamed protein product [Spirometra erinaceieuropaei]
MNGARNVSNNEDEEVMPEGDARGDETGTGSCDRKGVGSPEEGGWRWGTGGRPLWGVNSDAHQRQLGNTCQGLSQMQVYKEGAPLRPIVPLKGTPTYGLAKWLFRRLKFLTTDSDTTVCSTQFLEKLKEAGLLPNEVMVPFDVMPLFYHQDLAIETVELLLRSKYNETGIVSDMLKSSSS